MAAISLTKFGYHMYNNDLTRTTSLSRAVSEYGKDVVVERLRTVMEMQSNKDYKGAAMRDIEWLTATRPNVVPQVPAQLPSISLRNFGYSLSFPLTDEKRRKALMAAVKAHGKTAVIDHLELIHHVQKSKNYRNTISDDIDYLTNTNTEAHTHVEVQALVLGAMESVKKAMDQLMNDLGNMRISPERFSVVLPHLLAAQKALFAANNA